MESFWSAYGLFVAKTITLLALIVGALVASARLLRRKSGPREPQLQVKNLNDKYQAMADTLHRAMLPKHDLKHYLERRRHDDKQAERGGGAARPLVFVHIESMGGLVMSYGLAASQLARIIQAGVPLVVAVDQVAASGGYLMACVADRILAAPFAIVGSIGVVAEIPNLHGLLKKHDIDYELHTAGEYKRTLTVFGENTEQGRAKLKQELEETHALFKQFLNVHRPQLDLAAVATGDHWHGLRALELKLVDDLVTSDDFLSKRSHVAVGYAVLFLTRRSLRERLGLSRDKTLR